MKFKFGDKVSINSEYYGLEIKHLYNLYIKNNDCNFVEQKIININKLFNEEKINDC